MKFIFLVCGFLLLGPVLSLAETEEEEMQRMQEQLNSQLFNTGNEHRQPPPPAPVQVNEPPPPAASEPQAVADPEPAALPVSHFTGYKLVGLHVGMNEAQAFAVLKSAGYNCNLQAAKQAQAMLGRTICIYASMASPKVIMMTFVNDGLRDFEMEEEYKTGFPEEFFARKKTKFLTKYGKEAHCKTQRRGEICEVFGHGYRIMLRSKYRDEKASITHSFSTL